MSASRRLQPTALLSRYAQRFRELKQQLLPLEYFCKGTVLRRRVKCGKARCACRLDPARRHGPYFEWTYKTKGKTVNVKLTPQAAPLYWAASQQYRKLKALLNRLERLSQSALQHQARLTQSGRRHGP
ncbi:MAG: hypothetical protein DMG69_02965 [Acidobacteria bacterium]|nr:MAG: hypothetical protein DMG69_02965 [Acidobacteriota bacterium]